MALPQAPVADLKMIPQVLSPKPLLTNEELDRFYRREVNEVRGEDATLRLAAKFRQAFRAVPYKTFVLGHPGVGKSTEITRLLRELNSQYCGIRISITSELNPASFRVFDVLLLMMIKAEEEAKERLGQGLLDSAIARNLWSKVLHYLDDGKTTETRSRGAEFQAEAGFKLLKGQIKFAADRKSETVERHLKRLPELVDHSNRLIAHYANSLKNVEGKEWLFVLEDFDKSGIAGGQLKEVFVQYGAVFEELTAHMLFTIPVWLAYSDDALRLPFPKAPIHDTPVFDKYHADHTQGRNAVRAVLDARVSPELIEPEQAERLIVASGGNLRDLFYMVSDAADRALLRGVSARMVNRQDVTRAIGAMRSEYKNRLGESPYDPKPIHWDEKARKLLSVYHNEPGSDIPDPVLYSLLRARAVQ